MLPIAVVPRAQPTCGYALTEQDGDVDMVPVGTWNRQGTMDEEFLFRDNQTFYAEMGLG